MKTSKRAKQTFLQRRSANGQGTHKKMFSTAMNRTMLLSSWGRWEETEQENALQKACLSVSSTETRLASSPSKASSAFYGETPIDHA